jgi:hypothetical protein
MEAVVDADEADDMNACTELMMYFPVSDSAEAVPASLRCTITPWRENGIAMRTRKKSCQVDMEPIVEAVFGVIWGSKSCAGRRATMCCGKREVSDALEEGGGLCAGSVARTDEHKI